jgi:hypothetical protein
MHITLIGFDDLTLAIARRQEMTASMTIESQAASLEDMLDAMLRSESRC